MVVMDLQGMRNNVEVGGHIKHDLTEDKGLSEEEAPARYAWKTLIRGIDAT